MAQNKTPMRTALKQARGLGSAKSGVQHWWHQRLSALALVPLTIWAVVMVANLPQFSYAEALAAVSHPLNATLFILFLIIGFWHTSLGLQVVAEDYVAHEGRRFALIILIKGALILLGALAVFSVLQIAL